LTFNFSFPELPLALASYDNYLIGSIYLFADYGFLYFGNGAFPYGKDGLPPDFGGGPESTI
jgi:hypothetical protein